MIELSDRVILPVGIEVDGVRYREVIIDEMVGLDEENLASKKNQNNGGRAITILLRRCIQEIVGLVDRKTNRMSLISEDVVRKMYIADRDYLVVCIKALSNTSKILTEHECSSCSNRIESEIDFKDMDIYEWDEGEPAEVTVELSKGFYHPQKKEYFNKVVWSFPDGKVQEKIAAAESSKIASVMMVSVIKEVVGLGFLPSLEDVKMLSLKDRNIFAESFIENSVGVDTKISLTCQYCGAENESEVDLLNFFNSGGGTQKKDTKNGKGGKRLRKKR